MKASCGFIWTLKFGAQKALGSIGIHISTIRFFFFAKTVELLSCTAASLTSKTFKWAVKHPPITKLFRKPEISKILEKRTQLATESRFLSVNNPPTSRLLSFHLSTLSKWWKEDPKRKWSVISGVCLVSICVKCVIFRPHYSSEESPVSDTICSYSIYLLNWLRYKCWIKGGGWLGHKKHQTLSIFPKHLDLMIIKCSVISLSLHLLQNGFHTANDLSLNTFSQNGIQSITKV